MRIASRARIQSSGENVSVTSESDTSDRGIESNAEKRGSFHRLHGTVVGLSVVCGGDLLVKASHLVGLMLLARMRVSGDHIQLGMSE